MKHTTRRPLSTSLRVGALRTVTLVVAIGLVSMPEGLTGQDLEPRAFSNGPVGMNFIGGVYSYSTGNVLLETALPLEDLRANLHIVTGAYVRLIDFFGLSSKVDVAVPFARGKWSGVFEGQDTSAIRTGLGDPRLRWSVNFLGAPALHGAEFFQWQQKTIVGASAQVILPVGQYNPAKLVNLGSNRWTFKTRVGVSQRIRKWILEGIVAGWFFTPNNDFFGGSRLSQDPIWAAQAHVGYIFRPGLWLSADLGYGTGGAVTIDGVSQSLQKNTRLGLVLAIPIDRRNALRLAYVTGLSTRLGADFDTFGGGYFHRWGGMPKRQPGSPPPSPQGSSR